MMREGRRVTHLVAPWRVAYGSGRWLVLAGPTSLVVLDPSVDLRQVDDLWAGVLASSSMTELAHVLARHLGRVPHAGALFWDPSGLRAVMRGDVRVLDPETGAVVADGADLLTWREVGLGGLRRIRLAFGDQPAVGGTELPLVTGVVTASTVLLEAGPDDSVRSAQGGPAAVGAAPAEASAAVDPDTEPISGPPFTPVPGTPAPSTAPEPDPTPAPDIPTPVARLRAPDGSVVDLQRPVLIGRAPAETRPDMPEPYLLTVASPTHDVSRTHVEVAADDGQVVVTDMHSTNGTLVVGPAPGSLRVSLQPGRPMAVPVGSAIELGGGVVVRIEEPQ